MAKNYKHLLLAGLSGLLLALAYPGWSFDGSTSLTTSLGWLAWIGLVPLLWSLANAYENSPATKRQNFLLGFTAGLIYFLIVFRWLWSVHPLDTIGISNNLLSLAGVGLVYFISSAGMAVFWGFFGLAFSVQRLAFGKKSDDYKLQTTNYKLFLFVPALFVFMEYARSWGFGFLWAGSGSLFGPHWTLGNLAYPLADNSVIRWLASYVGIYGITFLIVLVNCLLAKTVYGHRMSLERASAILKVAAIPAVIIAISVAGYFNFNSGSTDKKISYAIIQTAQPTKLSPSPQEALAGFKEQLELLDRIAKEYPESQLIVFPEASDFFKNLSLFLAPPEVQNYFSKLFKEPRLIVAGGKIIDTTNGNAYSRVFSLDTQGDIIGFYDKHLLAPGGEFLPYPLKFLVYLFSKNSFSLFNEVRNLSPGQKEISTVSFRYQFNMAPIICSEAVSSELIKKTTQNSDVIVSMASYGIFHGSRTIANQMLAITRLRATENRKPIITAANMGRSHVIDSEGNIIKIADNGSKQILTGSVDITQQKSWYNKLGDWPILLASFLLVLSSILLIRFRKFWRL